LDFSSEAIAFVLDAASWRKFQDCDGVGSLDHRGFQKIVQPPIPRILISE